jgi:hypothetical protein
MRLIDFVQIANKMGQLTRRVDRLCHFVTANKPPAHARAITPSVRAGISRLSSGNGIAEAVY